MNRIARLLLNTYYSHFVISEVNLISALNFIGKEVFFNRISLGDNELNTCIFYPFPDSRAMSSGNDPIWGDNGAATEDPALSIGTIHNDLPGPRVGGGLLSAVDEPKRALSTGTYIQNSWLTLELFLTIMTCMRQMDSTVASTSQNQSVQAT